MPRVRLSGGRFGGQWLEAPRGIRPTTGRAREALLSIWQPHLAGARFLELFAGSGAVGLEALGRGARSVVLVDANAAVTKLLRDNLQRLAPGEPWQVLRLELPKELAVPALVRAGPYDLIFADPPYEFAAYSELVSGAMRLLAPGGRMAVEHSIRIDWELPGSGISCLVDRRRYGETCLTFYQRS